MKFFKKLITGSSMKQKIMTFTIGSVVLACAMLVFITSYLSQKALIAQINGNLHAISSAKASDVTDSINQFMTNMSDLTNAKTIQDALVTYEGVAKSSGLNLAEDINVSSNAAFHAADVAYRENFVEYLNSYPLVSFGLVLNNGFTVTQIGGMHLVGKNLLTGSLKSQAISTCIKNAIADDEYYTSMIEENGAYKSYYCHKIASKVNREGYKRYDQMGVLFAELEWGFFGKIKDFHDGLGETGELFIIDGNKMITPPKKLATTNINDLMKKKMTFDLKFDESVPVQNYKNLDGEDSYAVIRKLKILKTMNWYLVTQLSQKEALQSVNNLKKLSMIIMFVIVLIVSVLTALVINSLSKAFLSAGKGVSENTTKVNGTSTRFGEIATTISGGAHQQSAALQETSTTMEEINVMVQETLKLSKQSSIKSNTCVEKAHEGVQKMTILVDSVTTVGRVTHQSFENVKESNNSLLSVLSMFKEVESKTKVINSIAFQTKLLSFNASVEAARAGEHGKGFAVVAEEIGQLAELVNRSSAEINTLIDTTAEKIGNLVEESRIAVEESLVRTEKEILSSQKDAQEGLEFFKGLSSIIADITNEVTQVSIASEEQSRGIAQINQAIAQISDANGKNVMMSSELEAQTTVLEEAVFGLTIANSDLNNTLLGDKS